MASSDTMETETGIWYSETVLERLDRCRKFLYGQGIITETVNDAVRKELEESRNLEIRADRDQMAEVPEHLRLPEPEEGDGPEAVD